MRLCRLTYFALLLLSVCSCKAVSGLIHDEDVVAEVGAHKLYRSVLEEAMPKGTTGQDSVDFARQYIDSWARDLVFLDVAEKQLSKEEKDVSSEMEEYRKSLLKYRYEQRYINERLDTNVTTRQIEDYYKAHEEEFKLEMPIVKARFMRVVADAPNIDLLKEKMSSDKQEEVMKGDSLSYSSAQRYTDYGGKWIDIVSLAREFGTDYETLLSGVKNSFVQMPDGDGNLNVAYIADKTAAGETAPLEYCYDRIEDIIISSRKHALVSTLEQDLLDKARSQGYF